MKPGWRNKTKNNSKRGSSGFAAKRWNLVINSSRFPLRICTLEMSSLASVYELQPRTCLEAASDGCAAGQWLYSLKPGFAVAIQIKEAVERLLGGVHFRESRLEAGTSW